MRFRDGSLQIDIPLAALAAQFAATHFIVSQVYMYICIWIYIYIYIRIHMYLYIAG